MSRKTEPAPTDRYAWDRKKGCAVPKRPMPIHMYHMA